MEDDAELLAEQRAYYRARAPQYDEWWQRRGRYDRGDDEREEWDRQVAVLADALTVVDASAETLSLNRERVGRDDVAYVVADLFDWRPDRRYDVVFFSFWLSHVPRARFGEFWSLVRHCLAPGGRAFLIDNRTDPQPASPVKDPYVVTYEHDLHRRRLADGTEWRVVKVMYEPDELNRLIGAAGWRAQIDGTRWFLYGAAEPAGPAR